MGRRRKGVVPTDDGRWTAALPVAVGATRRVQLTDVSEAAVRRWYADGEAALGAGEPLPDPDAYRTRNANAEPQPVGPRLRSSAWWAGATAADGHLFVEVAHAWVEQRYRKLRHAQPERRQAVLAIIDNNLSPWLRRKGVTTIEAIENQLVADLATELAGRPSDAGASTPATPWPHLGARRELTAQEAYALDGVSRSTVSRWRRNGQLPGWHVDDADGRARVPVSELRAARMAQQVTERVEQTGLFSSTAQNKLNVLKHILDFADANGVPLTGDPMRGISAVESEAELAGQKSATKHMHLRHVRPIAAHLPVVQQLSLWLERILGVRIGEGFGPYVGDFVDFGDASAVAGCLAIGKQGGRPFQVLEDGVIVRRPSKEQLKTDQSVRVIPLPRQLVALIRVVVAAFHTDPVRGEVDMSARLVPGLRVHDESGQQAHRNALKAAASAAATDEARFGRIHPHRFRADLITDLQRAKVDPVAARRFVGHIAGDTVHERNYMLDPADVTPTVLHEAFDEVIAAIEASIDKQLGGSLMVPTAERETWGRSNRLYSRRAHIYATLAAAGWFVEPQTDDGEPLASSKEVAAALDIADNTARRWMRTGELPGRLVARGGREVWCMTYGELERVVAERAESPTINELAAELNVTYPELYSLMGKNNIRGAQKRKGGDIRLSREDADAIRAHQHERAELSRRSMPLSEAAVALDVPVMVLETALRQNVLKLDREASTSTARFVTRQSVAAYAETRRKAVKPVSVDDPAIADAEVRALTGLNRLGLTNLVQAGILVPIIRDRRRFITTESLRDWATDAQRTDVLARLSAHDG